MNWSQLLLVLFLTIPEQVFTRRCSRYPSNTFTPKSPVDENFVISITGNAQTYILGQSYNVSLHAYNGHRFINAKLVLENANGEKSFKDDLGHLEVSDPIETRYSPNCINMIESTNTNPKTKLEMVWIAPSEPGNGCVLIRATVLQHRDVWFMDDGGLTKRVCEEVVDDVESHKKDDDEIQCCACDEARYDITFEGMWSRNLHPKDFPTRGWLTRFSDILGAAHTSDYRFWDMGVLATNEMKEFAEHGSAVALEREFNHYFKQGKIRTIIKARGPAFPYLNSPTVASIRVDPMHHQLSMASKIVPSPDWIVGVAGLELCLTNCTWLEMKVINLYPWDIGTDAGPSYTSPDQPQLPPDVIRRMRSDYPPDPRSPFFDESGVPMKPLATLTIKRQRIYERKCPDDEFNDMQDVARECLTHPWSSWSKCSAECGEGRQYRSRVYKQPDVAKIYNCDANVINHQERLCQGENCGHMSNAYVNPNFEQSGQWPEPDEEEQYDDGMSQLPVKAAKTRAECMIGPWSSWSPCNATCGDGEMLRTRQYIKPFNTDECQEIYFLKLNEYKKCVGTACMGRITNEDNNGNDYEQQPEPYEAPEISQQYNSHYDQQIEQFQNPDRIQRPEEPFKRQYLENINIQGPSYDFESESLRREQSGEDTDLRPYKKQMRYPLKRISERKDLNNIRPAYQISDELQGFTNYKAPEYCYQPLNTVQTCRDPRVVGNFWFYNYCTEECMLYAADVCDRNRNKFLSLEQCQEHCKWPMRNMEIFFKQKQRQECHGGRQQNGRNFKKRKQLNAL